MILVSICYVINYFLQKLIFSKIKQKKIYEILKKNSYKIKYKNSEYNTDKVDMNQTNFQSFEEMKNCIICFEDVNEGETMTKIPDCKHEMHMDCLLEWTKIKNSCPICRSQIRLD